MKVEMQEYNNLLGQIDGAYHDVATRLGLSDSMFDILYVICDEGEGCYQSALYKKTGLGKSTVNSTVKKMEKQELLVLKPGDGRNTCVYLTEGGRKILRDDVEPVIRIENEIFESWTKEEQELFLDLNRRFLNDFLRRTSKLGKEL